MSYWGATVITNLLTAFGSFGKALVVYIWGGEHVGDKTLKRFFVFHIFSPFLLIWLRVVHVYQLHQVGSGNPMGVNSDSDCVSFYPYFFYKDLFGFVVFAGILGGVVLGSPDLFSDPNNFIPADPIKTPVHIQPEWYFLFAYSILRRVFSKIGGVLMLMASVFILFIFPFFPPSAMTGFQFNLTGQFCF